MSILARFTPSNLNAERYDQVLSKLQEGGHWPPDGMEYHCCFGQGEELRVSEVWDSPEKMQAYGEHLMPVLQEVGIDAGEPEIIEVHNTQSR